MLQPALPKQVFLVTFTVTPKLAGVGSAASCVGGSVGSVVAAPSAAAAFVAPAETLLASGSLATPLPQPRAINATTAASAPCHFFIWNPSFDLAGDPERY